MQNQNMQPWAWGQAAAPSFPAGPVFPSAFSPAAMDQSQIMPGYQQMYGAAPAQPPPDYGASQWSAAQLQHWQQWQQWQEKYQQWQAQYGKKYAESIAAMGQNPGLVLPGVPPASAVMKPGEAVANPGYTTANPPPPPSNAQPVPPPPPEEDKPTGKDRSEAKGNESDGIRESPEELSEAEKTFDIQFKQWEDQFNEWKKQNQDHPDKVQYREYEKKWETWREQLLQRREQMRKKRISKAAEISSDVNSLGKNEESKVKFNQGQVKSETGNYRIVESQNSDAKSAIDAQVLPQGKAQEGMNVPGNFVFPNMDAGFPNLPGSFEKEGQNFICQGPPPFAPGSFEHKFRVEGGRDPSGPRFEPSRNDLQQRRLFGNGSFEENFAPRFGGFDVRKPNQDRFGDSRLKDGKFATSGRDFAQPGQLTDPSFKRNFIGEMKPPFMQNPANNNLNNSFSKPKVPSLFDITVEKPPGLRSPGKDKKPKIWEQEKDNYFEDKADEKNSQRNECPWLSNVAWASNNSPWIKPWELDRVVAEKPLDAHLRPDAWQKEPITGKRNDDNPWADGRKPEMDKSELSGYVGKILAKLGNFNVLPPNVPGKETNVPPGYAGDNARNMDDNADGKQPFQGKNWSGKNDHSGRNPNFGPDGGGGGGGVGGGSSVNDREDIPLFGRGDCDDRVRFERDRPNFPRDNRNFGSDSYRREERGSFPDGGRNEEERFFGKGDRPCGKFVDDIDERVVRNRDRNGRRGFEDRDDRVFRGMYDRDERRNRNFNAPFDRFGRGGDSSAKELEWKPQVFDYSSGNQPNSRTRFSDPDDNFHIPTVVDYSHGENKQTFDYGHGEGKNENLPVKSFDYGHGRESPAVIDYGHGSDKDLGLQKWKKESQDKTNELNRHRSKSKSPQRRSRSPRGRLRSRSRSPHSGGRGRRDSNSPPFRGHRSRSRDRFNRQITKRNRRNNSEDNSIQNTDGEVSKNNFDVTTVLVEDLICSPGRESRPNKLVFIMRGLPGSGKTYVTKLIKDKEVELGGDAPRILSLDDYFMTEVEKEVVDEETGRKMKKKVLEYEYESCAEPHYRGSLLKAFKKTISDGFFGFIIVDSVNEKTKDYEEMWSFAKQKGFQVYVAEMDDDVTVCTKRNIHKRNEKEISELAKAWEKTPNHFLRLDVRSLLQADAITEVEMEVVSDTDLDKMVDPEKAEEKEENETKEDEEERLTYDELVGVTWLRPVHHELPGATLCTTLDKIIMFFQDEPGESAFVKSRWDHFENSEQKLDRLDGLKRRREGFHATMEDYLQLPDDFELGSSEPTDGKKKVRWADLEERRQQEKMRAIGFVVGQTDWSRMTDPTFGESALTRTKYI